MTYVHNHPSISATDNIRVIDGITYDFNNLNDCCRLIDVCVYEKVNTIISNYSQHVGPPDLRKGKITFEQYVKKGETDSKQHTQCVTKFLQYFFADAVASLVEEYGLPFAPGNSSGCDYIHTPTGVRVEFKSTGGKDGAGACLGNLGVNGKADFTLVCRYCLEGNTITEKQTVTIDDSARKWREYNGIKKFDSAGNAVGSSNYSQLKCRPSDIDDICVISGYIKENTAWIKFNKQKI